MDSEELTELMMNAFRRSKAIMGLEDLSLVIAIHLTLIASFPDNPAKEHWSGEVRGFIKILKRYGNAKKRKGNYTHEIIRDAISVYLTESEEQDFVEAAIEAKGLPYMELNWDKAMIQLEIFCEAVI